MFCQEGSGACQHPNTYYICVHFNYICVHFNMCCTQIKCVHLETGASNMNSTKGRLTTGYCSVKDLYFQIVSIRRIVSHLTRAMNFHKYSFNSNYINAMCFLLPTGRQKFLVTYSLDTFSFCHLCHLACRQDQLFYTERNCST